jgi:signal peptidase I
MDGEASAAPLADVPAAEPERAAAEVIRRPSETRRANTFTEYVESLLVTVLLALFGTTFVVQAFKIPSQSMEPTLLVGDHLLVNKFVFEGRGAWYEKFLPYRPIRRGDIIVFKFPYDDHPHYVKRVIGVPGDRIRIVNEQVFVNGAALAEPYVVHDPAAGDFFGEYFPPRSRYFSDYSVKPEWATKLMDYVDRGELVVPPHRYFAMGDNRDRSWDSRYWGFVDQGAIMGRPVLIYWSVEATSSDYNNRTLGGTLRGIVDTLLHLPSQTRWRRMMREVH